MQLLPRVCFCFLTLSGLTFGDRSGKKIISAGAAVFHRKDGGSVSRLSLNKADGLEGGGLQHLHLQYDSAFNAAALYCEIILICIIFNKKIKAFS